MRSQIKLVCITDADDEDLPVLPSGGSTPSTTVMSESENEEAAPLLSDPEEELASPMAPEDATEEKTTPVKPELYPQS